MKARCDLTTPTTTTTTTLEFELCGTRIALDSVHLQFGVAAVGVACEVTAASSRGMASSDDMCQSELAFACLYTRAVDRFLCKDPRHAYTRLPVGYEMTVTGDPRMC